MAIESWSSEGMDWSSESSLSVSSLYNACEAVRLAVAERQRALSSLVSGSIFASGGSVRLMTPWNFASQVQSAVSALIPLFANHEDNGGDWNGIKDVWWNNQNLAPAWTEAGVLESLGDESRLAPSRLGEIRPWLWQQYRILNKLRWIKAGTSAIRSQKSGEGGSWAKALSAYDSNSWLAISSEAQASHKATEDLVMGYCWIDRTRSSCSAVSCPMGGKIDLYAIFFTRYYNYVNNDYPDAKENEWKLLAQDIDKSESVEIGYFDACTMPEPSGVECYQWEAYPVKAIYKPAFSFKDW